MEDRQRMRRDKVRGRSVMMMMRAGEKQRKKVLQERETEILPDWIV